jgi:hypothetical protein
MYNSGENVILFCLLRCFFVSFSGRIAQFTLRTWLQFLCLRHFLHQHYNGACAQSLPNELKSEVNSKLSDSARKRNKKAANAKLNKNRIYIGDEYDR